MRLVDSVWLLMAVVPALVSPLATADPYSQDFESGWTTGSFVTETNADGWVVSEGMIRGSGIGYPTPNGSYACFLNQLNGDTPPEPYVQTPALTNGIGTLTFDAAGRSATTPQELTIEVSTNGSSWTVHSVVTNSANINWEAYSVVINLYGMRYIRLRKTADDGASGTYLGLEDIQISVPPAYVEVTGIVQSPSPAVVQTATTNTVTIMPYEGATSLDPYLLYSTDEGGSFATNDLLATVSNQFVTTFPGIPAQESPGTVVDYYIRTVFDDGGTTRTNLWPEGAPGVTTNYVVEWRSTDIFTNTTYNGWALTNGLIYQGSSWFNVLGQGSGTPSLTSILHPNGIGVVSFDMKNNLSTNLITFEIQRSADGATWNTTLATVTNGSAALTNYSLTVNHYDPAYVRIIKTGDDSSAYHHLVINNLSVTEPSSYVLFSNLVVNPEPPHSGGTVDINVDIEPFAGANNIFATLYYAFSDTNRPFTSTIDMEHLGDNEYRTIEPVTISGLPGETFNFYIEASFQGTAPDSPATHPESGTQQRFIGAPVLQATYTNVIVTGSATTNLFAATNHFWRGVVDATNGLTNPNFYFQTESNTWGDAVQTSNTTPFVGEADLGDTITIQETLNRYIYFAFFDGVSNESYQVSECEYVNFNGWNETTFGSHSNPDGWNLGGRMNDTSTNETDKSFDGRYAMLKHGESDEWLRSPSLPDGLGSISFWYRNWYNNAAQPAAFRIEKAPGAGGPWTEVALVTNILSADWLYFSVAVSDPASSHVRIANASDIAAQSWLGLDEVAVTEPGSSVSFGVATNSPASPILGDTVTVSVPATPLRGATSLACSVYYRWGSSAPFTAIPAALNGGIFSAEIPPSPQGTIEYYFACTFDGIEPHPLSDPSDAPDSVHSFVVSGDLPPERFQDFDDDPGWTIGSDFTNQTYVGWEVWDSRVVGTGIGKVPPYSSPYKCSLNALLDGGVDAGQPGAPYLQSPLTSNGVGSITFFSRSRISNPQVSAIQTKPDGGVTWTTVAQFTNSSTAYVTNSVYLNTYQDLYVKVVKLDDQGQKNQYLAIDDIYITYPPSDVTISNVYHAPAYPAQNQDLTVYADMGQVNPNYPAFGFEPVIVHRQGSGPWATNSMGLVSGSTYGGTIPAYPPGNVEYYVRCDFDGVYYQSGSYSENRSPAFSPDAEHTEALPATFHGYNVRYYRSDFETIAVTGNFDTAESELIANDTWQGLFYVDGTNQLTIGLNGTGYALNSQQSPSNTYWGDSDQWQSSLPAVGTLDLNGSNIVFDGVFSGYYLLRFDMETGDYRVLAADWQDFDTWPLHDTQFAEGAQGDAPTSEQETFNDWTLSADESVETYFEGTWTNRFDWEDSEVGESDVPDNYWLAEKFRIVNTDSNSNHRIEFRDIAGEGRIRPHYDHYNWGDLRGAGTMSFKYRATDTNTYRVVCAEAGSGSWSNYTYAASIVGEGDNTDEGCYWSLLYHYQDANNYYEMRVIATNSNQLVMQIVKHFGGVESIVNTSSAFSGQLNNNASISAKVFVDGDGVDHEGYYNGGNWRVRYLNESTDIIGDGGIGLAAHDVNMIIDAVEVSAGEDYEEDFNSTPSDWSDPAWNFDVSTGTYRREGRYAGGLGFTVYSSLLTPGPWTLQNPLDWIAEVVYTNITTLGYVQTTANVHRPDTYATPILKHTDGYGSLRFDNLAATSWQGDDVTHNTPSSAWIMGDGWIDNDDPYDGRYCELRASRAMYTTDFNQYLRSPLMSSAGPVNFMYRTGGSDAEIAIRWKPDGGSYVGVTNLTLPAEADWTSFSYPINTNAPGFVQLAHISSNMNARLLIDDLTFFDYHQASTNTWVAYNALLTQQQEDKLYRSEGRSGYLNHDDDTDTLFGRVFADAPYIRSPYLREGIGEISFWYRNWSTNGGLDTSLLVVETSPDTTTWTPLATIAVDNDVYTRHVITAYDTDNHFVRFRNDTSGEDPPDRLCLDSILVAAPIATDLIVSNAWTIPPIPVYTNTVKIRAELTDFILSPSNVDVNAYWKLGTNDWATWEYYSGTPMSMSELVSEQYTNNGRTVYVYETDGSIPAQDADEVVQYFVRASFDGELFANATSPRLFKSGFQNPAAYEPADYNEQHGGGTNVVPYYVVYSCPPGSVWINEINILENTYPWGDYEYVELCGLSGIDLTGWRLVIEDAAYSTSGMYTVWNNTTLGWDTNGFGFWVLGDTAVSPDQTFTNNPDAEGNNLPHTGGISLFRSIGALEMSVSYYSEFGSQFDALSMTNRGFTCIDIADSWLDTEPLALVGTGSSVNDFTWSASSGGYTPGSVNYSQSLLDVNNPPSVLTIGNVWSDTTNTWITFLVSPTDRMITNSDAWYSTNLLVPGWVQISNGGYSGSGGSYTQWFDVMTNAPIFYKIEAKDDQ